MQIGVPTEIKNNERRVGMTPEAVKEVVGHGHTVLVQAGAGLGIGASDAHYQAAGATTVATAADVYAAELVVKVKEPQAAERAMLRPGQTLFTYLHLAPDPDQTRELVDSGVTAIAYETVTGPGGGLPLLAPMSQVAGRLAVQAGAHALESPSGGRGILLGGVPGVRPADVLIIGGGVAGSNAATIAFGMGAKVTVLDRNAAVLERLDERFGSQITTEYATRSAVENHLPVAELVIGAVLLKGARAPRLIYKDDLAMMQTGSVLVDISIDQGGCFETSRPTTHADPTYVVDGVVHYCVANMPGAVARTSTYALNNVTLPHVIALADKGTPAALTADPHLLSGLNVHAGKVTEAAVAEALGYDYVDALTALAA
jgi:alanine dehydrogenase